MRYLYTITFTLLLCVSSRSANFDVTSYGAVGDMITNTVSTISNSTLVVSTTPVTFHTNNSIEIIGVGTVTVAPKCQDFIGVITNIINGTNLYLNAKLNCTLASTTIYYGTNNTLAINAAYQAAVADSFANSRNNTVTFAPGNYLCLGMDGTWFGRSAIQITGGGVMFTGSGTNLTTITSQGAWTLRGGEVWRGFLFEVISSTNDRPWGIQNMTLFGGVPQGNTSNHNFPASTTDGTGWDVTHSALTIWNDYSGTGIANMLSSGTLSNVLVSGWRGEMLKSIDRSINGTLLITNVTFADGNATAINIYQGLDVAYCQFTNMFKGGEYYQQYAINRTIIRNSIFQNITGSFFAINGATGTNAPFIFANNTFLWSAAGGNGIEFGPACNVTITNNYFPCELNTHPSLFVTLDYSTGAQGTFVSSNIDIGFNTISNGYQALILSGMSPLYKSVNYRMRNNLFVGFPAGGVGQFVGNTSHASPSDILIYSNNAYDGNYQMTVQPDDGSGIYPYVSVTNDYWALYLVADVGGNVAVSYGEGSKYRISFNYANGTKWYMQTNDASRIPTGASVLFSNSTANSQTIPIYYDSGLSRVTNVPAGGVALISFASGYWTNLAGATTWTLTVNNGSGSGTYLDGSTASITAYTNPIPGSSFLNWSGDTVANSNSATTTLTMSGNRTVTANYRIPPQGRITGMVLVSTMTKP